LHATSGGRFVLGLGASTPRLAEGLHDTPFEPPVPRMRRMVTQIRALLRGERIPLAVTPPGDSSHGAGCGGRHGGEGA